MLRHLYFVSIDIRHAFDTIDHDKLMAVMEGILQDDEYMMRRYASVVSAGGKARRRYNRHVCVAGVEAVHFVVGIVRGCAYRSTCCCSTGDFAQFSEFAGNLSKEQLRDALLIDQVVYPFQERQELLSTLNDIVRNNIVRVGKRFYRQRTGISQGSLLSTLLCRYAFVNS